MEKLIDTQAIVSQATVARHSQHTVVIFGEVLFDDFPDGAVLGGAPFNVAWHLQAFGLHPVVISRTGNDAQRDQMRPAQRRLQLGAALGVADLAVDRDASVQETHGGPPSRKGGPCPAPDGFAKPPLADAGPAGQLAPLVRGE